MAEFFTQIGPDKAGNLHQHRPYFLLPLKVGARDQTETGNREPGRVAYVEGTLAAAQDEAMGRIKAWVGQAPVSDVYVLSHGWHRNFYSAVSAYDRLASRWVVLFKRGRLPLPGGVVDYNPLLLTLHWSSEIGSDGWVDLSGRRAKTNFLANASGYWDDADPQFLNVFEDAFELFSALCAPDIDALDSHLMATSRTLWTKLEAPPKGPAGAAGPAGIQMKGCLGDLDTAERVALAWKCYHEATATGVHVPQQTPPRGFAGGGVRAEIIIKFLLAAGVLATVFIKLAAAIFSVSKPGLEEAVRAWPARFGPTPPALVWTGTALAVGALSLVLLAAVSSYSRGQRSKAVKYGLGWVSLIPWGLAQALCAIPLLVSVLLLYLLPSSIATAIGLFPERDTRRRGQHSTGVFETLSTLARWPGRILNGALEADSLLGTISNAVDSQLAFFEMQNRGVDAGEEAAGKIREVMSQPGLEHARLHLVGHSFGGLLVANVARALARPASVSVHSLTFIEGAFGSAWLENEPDTVRNVTQTIASMYSGYDSATGFYYPLANAARLSAGSVGLCQVPDPSTSGAQLPGREPNQSQPWCKPGCTERHVHRPSPFASLADPPRLPGEPDKLSVLNIDTSRMVFAGSAVSGGAHTDIYKDDIVNLIWSTAHRESV